MTTATMRLIERVERLEMTGEIGDGTVAQLHELAGLARLEQNPADVLADYATKAGFDVDPEKHEAMRAHCDEPTPLPSLVRTVRGLCGANRVCDQMLCPCGLAWDCDDPDPPACPAKAA